MSISNRARFCVALFAALVVSVSSTLAEEARICRYCEQAQQAALAADAPDSAPHYAPDRNADVLHIKLDVTPDFEHKTVAGTASITFKPIAKPLTELTLHGVHLNIHDVRSTHSIDDYSVTADDLTIVFRKPIAEGEEFKVDVDYDAEPSKGLYFRTSEMGYDSGDEQIWTQGEPHEARHWFPCFDYPNERSSTEIICHVPKGMTVLSNGVRLGEEVDAESDTKAVHWRQDKPHANYLICLVAGYLDKLEKKHGDIPLSFYTPPSYSQHAANSFRDTADIMAFFEEEIGVPFPWDKYAQVAVLDFHWGGMENTSLTTLTTGTIFSEETENIESSRGLDAHEMAHQWFGDYVTCKDWSHLWLNEGFATYYAHLHAEHQFGRDALLYGMYRDAERRVLPKAKDHRPIVYKDYKNPGEQFDHRAYPKGSWVLHMLRSQLGPDLYRQCIRTYLEKHALSSVVSEELNSTIEEVTGRSFDRFFDQWVFHPGNPDLKVSYRWLPAEKLAKVTVEQLQSDEHGVMVFQFPTAIRFIGQGETVDHEVEISQRKHEFFVPLKSKPEIVRFDPEYTVLASVNFRKNDGMLLKQLANDEDVIGRLRAIEALKKRKTQAAIKALTECLNNDPFHGVRRAAASALQDIGEDDGFLALSDSLDQQDARVRLHVVEQLARFYSSDARDVLLRVVETEKNPAVSAAAIKGLGRYSGEEVEQRLLAALETDTFGQRTMMAAVSAIGDHKSPEFGEKLMGAIEQRERELSSWQMSRALRVLSELEYPRKRRAAVREFVGSYLEHPKTGIQVAAVRALGELGNKASARVLNALANSSRQDRVVDAAKEAAKKIDQRTSTKVTDLKDSLNKLRERQEELEDQIDDLQAMVAARGKQKDDRDVADADKPQKVDSQVSVKDAVSGQQSATSGRASAVRESRGEPQK